MTAPPPQRLHPTPSQTMPRRAGLAWARGGVLCALLAALSGCHLLKPTPAGQIDVLSDPDDRGKYCLYKPVGFASDRSWPLLVLCHAAPWSNPRSIIADWDELADQHHVLLIAPSLAGASDLAPALQRQQRLQEQDEAAIMAAVQQVRAAITIDQDRIFIAGQTSGCRAALFTGLRHPEVFRAVALLQPRFDASHVGAVAPFVDPYQRVLIVRGMGDVTAGDQADAAITWMRSQKMSPSELRTARRMDFQPEMAYEFFRRTVQLNPLIRVEVSQTGSTRRINFHVRTSLADVHSYVWDFGDGSEPAKVPNPQHEYAQSGEYQITLTIQPDQKSKETLTRRIRIVLPPQ